MNNQVSPRLMQQAHQKQQQAGVESVGNQETMVHPQPGQGSITANAGNLIIGQKQKKQEFQNAIQSFQGLSDFKQKVNIMLQNQMYLGPENILKPQQQHRQSSGVVKQYKNQWSTDQGYVYRQGQSIGNDFEYRKFESNSIEGVPMIPDTQYEQGVNLRNASFKNNHHSLRKGSGARHEATSASYTSGKNTSDGLNSQFSRVQKINRNNQYEQVLVGGTGSVALSPTNAEISQKNSHPKNSASGQEKKFHTFTNNNSNGPQTQHAPMKKQFYDQNVPQKQGYHSYSTNNQKQQQRRKLLFEYGLEKKLQNQSIQQTINPQSQNVPVYNGPGGPGPWVSNPQSQKNANLKKEENLLNEKETRRRFKDLLECLKNVNIDQLDKSEQEKLKFLSDQYQYYLHFFHESLNESAEKPSTGQGARYSNMSQFSKVSEEVNKFDPKSDIYKSQEKFKENEKNLSEYRLHRRKNKEENNEGTPMQSINYPQIDDQSTNQNSLKKLPVAKAESNNSLAVQGIQAEISKNPSEKKLTQSSSKSKFTIKNGITGNLDYVSNTGQKVQSTKANDLSEYSDKLSSSHNQAQLRKMQIVPVQDIGSQPYKSVQGTNEISTTESSQVPSIATGFQATLLGKAGPSIFDTMKAVQHRQNQQAMFINQVDKPPTTPLNGVKRFMKVQAMTVQDIKNMMPINRMNIFKQLQKREKQKFISIQQQKIAKLEGQFDRNKKSARGQPHPQNLDQKKDLKSQNERFLDIVRRQNFNSGSAQLNYEQIRKQWISDLKAFGVFQQNELWQFGQMTESQQRQILICNLQQGKFNGLQEETSLILQQQAAAINYMKDKQNNGTIWQQQRRHIYGSALANVGGSTQQESNFQMQNNPNAFRNSLNVTSSKKNSNELDEKKESSSPFEPIQDSNVTPNKSERSRSFKLGPEEVECLNTIDKQSTLIQNRNSRQFTHEMQNTQPISKLNNYGEIQAPSDFNQQEPQSAELVKGSPSDYQQDATSFSGKRTSNDGNGDNTNRTAHKTGKSVIVSKYEDSKLQFEICLKEILDKYDGKGNIKQGGKQMGLNDLLPNFPKHLMKGKFPQQQKDQQETQKPADKPNSWTIQNDKLKPKTKTVEKPVIQQKGKATEKSVEPETSRVGIKKQESEATKKEGDEKTEEKEVVPEEPKKPRYFPPRRIPNPFEHAAQEQEKFIQARKDALAKYSNISKNRFKQDESQPYKYVLRPGNNHRCIMNVLQKSGRLEPKHDSSDEITFPGWEPADDHYDSLYNFKWKPTSGGIKYDMISKHGLKQLVNHVRGHGSITTKDNLFINMKAYYESQRLNIYDVVPLTIVLDYLKDDVSDRVEQFLSIMKIIDKNIEQDVEVINKKLHESQIQKEKALKTPFRITECCHNSQNLWMLKPTGFNRGIGIHIFQTFDQLRDIMSTGYGIGRGSRDKASIFQTHNHNHNNRDHIRGEVQQDGQEKQQQMRNFTFVIQKLIEKPFLYLKRKFDIRQWVLMNTSDGKIYIYKEPYVRTSSKEYLGYDSSLPNEDQIFMQLTNNAIQKDGADYGKFEEGNIISQQTLFKFVAQQSQAEGKGEEELISNFKNKMIEIITNSVKCAKGKIFMQKHTFELLGYDFIFDEQLNTILIEVNTNPCLEESNNLLKHLVPRMIDDTLNIVMDPLFGTHAVKGNNHTDYDYNQSSQKCRDNYKSAFKIPGEVFGQDVGHSGYKDEENLWEYIYTMEN